MHGRVFLNTPAGTRLICEGCHLSWDLHDNFVEFNQPRYVMGVEAKEMIALIRVNDGEAVVFKPYGPGETISPVG